MSPRRSLALAAVLVLVALSSCSKEADAPPPGVADAAFYAAPDPLPSGRPGDVLRVDEIEGTGDAGQLLRVLYRSESTAGEPIAVSGVIAVPPGDPPAGGWPVLSLAHGTVGLADACAPSIAPGGQATMLAARGYVVVASDYEGLGTAGRHPYLVGESEARGVIDGVRAARALGDGVGAGTRFAVVGYSQGGHAALFSNEIVASWAPELTLVGAVAGVPVVELDTWVGQLSSPTWDWLKVMLVAGFEAVDPAADPARVLTPAAVERLPVVDEQCSGEVMGAFADGGALAGDLRRTAPFDALLAANTPGQRAGAAPVLLIGGGADVLIPPALLDLAFARLCVTGQVVDRRTHPDADHLGVVSASLEEALRWVTNLFAGATARDTCP